MKKIKKITIVSNTQDRVYEIGKDNIKEIMDNSEEFKNEVYSQYRIIGKGKKILTIIENCPVVIDYET